MKIDNFNRIETFLKDDDPLFFYDCQILRRGKDHPELPAANWCVKSICIHGKNNLIKHIDEIVKLCETFGARAYISLARRSNRKCIETAVKCFADRLYMEDSQKPESVWWHAVGITVPENKIWIIDIDTKDWQEVLKIQEYIESKKPNKPIIGIIPTINGYHIICNPFDCSECVEDKIDEYSEIKKHGLTLLYA